LAESEEIKMNSVSVDRPPASGVWTGTIAISVAFVKISETLPLQVLRPLELQRLNRAVFAVQSVRDERYARPQRGDHDEGKPQ
jgi:hypothetical protein